MHMAFHDQFAIKMEKRKDKTSVKSEAKVCSLEYMVAEELTQCVSNYFVHFQSQVLRKLQSCLGICKMIDEGAYRQHFYIQMEVIAHA